MIKKILSLITGKHKIYKELRNVREKAKKQKMIIEKLNEENKFLKATINEFAIDAMNRINVATNGDSNFVVNKAFNEGKNRKKVVDENSEEKESSSDAAFQDYHSIQYEDEEYKKMLVSCNPENLGVGNQLKSGEPIVYKSLSENEIDATFAYLKDSQKEQEIELSNKTKVVLSGHNDKSISASFYDDEVHIRSISTANNEKAKKYSEEDIKEIVQLYAKRED